MVTMVRRIRASAQRLSEFARSYTSGLKPGDVRRLFDQDASRVYAVLARDHAQEAEPSGRFRRFLHRVRVVFLGLSYKLTPARRLLFALALVLAFLGLVEANSRGNLVIGPGNPFLLVGSIAALIYLLALELADRVLIRDELEVARQLQRELLPSRSPTVPGYAFAHSYRTANEVGGDYYDFPPLADGRLAVVAGDASGHGMAAGLVMAIANATLNVAMDIDPRPERVAAILNRSLWRTGTRRNFMSLFYGILDPASGELEYLCSGHPFPLLRRDGGTIEELGNGGFPLGVREILEPATASAALRPGDTLVIHSDGLPEARNARGEVFGYERLAALLKTGGTPQEIHDRTMRALDDFRGDEPLIDDVSLVIVGRQARPAGPPPPPPTPVQADP